MMKKLLNFLDTFYQEADTSHCNADEWNHELIFKEEATMETIEAIQRFIKENYKEEGK